jgi:hypothetical protein
MKIAMIALASLATLSTTAFAGQVQYGTGVASPEKGVICDTRGKWCADGTGLSASWTSQYFGADAASKLDGVDQSSFGYSNRVKCVIATQSCTGGDAAAAKAMQAMLFGAAAGGGSGGSAQLDFGNGVYSPEKGVICDGVGKWCADGTGLSASWTEQYFGGDMASKLSGATQDKFGFSNKVNCDVNAQTCTGGAGKAAKKMTKALFR